MALIRRTIDKPSEKLELLLNYIKENKETFRFYLKFDKDIILYNIVYLYEDTVCKILKITKKTLRNWLKRYKIKSLSGCFIYEKYYIPDNRINLFSEPTYSKISDIYINIYDLLYFITTQKECNEDLNLIDKFY